jgi:hypothetical protein
MKNVNLQKSRLFRLLAICGITLAGLLGCASNDIQHLVSVGQSGLNPTEPVYITVPKDPTDTDYAGTGQFVADVIAGQLNEHHIQLSIATSPADDQANLDAARKQNAAYIFVPVITNWEHNATQWSFNPSTMGLRITIIEVASGKQLRVDDIQGKSSHISFFGTDPKELLKDSIEKYIDQLYP